MEVRMDIDACKEEALQSDKRNVDTMRGIDATEVF